MSSRLPRATALLSLFFLALPGWAGAPVPAGIRLCSVGYPSSVAKRATVAGAAEGVSEFSIVDLTTGEVALSGPLGAARPSPQTGETVREADFTDLPTGRYELRVEGLPASAAFTVGDSALNDSLALIMMGFYGQRCGMAVRHEHGGEVFAHAACHLDDGYLDYVDPARAGEIRDGVGGWHDAGDYGKYAVNSGFTLGIMLAAWEQYGDRLRHLRFPIPESGGALPDYLAELKYNLDWMFKLQGEDGHVAHKLTRLYFGPFRALPETDHEKRFFTPWSTSANANFAASMAMAARVYRPYDPAYADRCKAAAIRAWDTMQPAWREVRADLSAFHTGAYVAAAGPDVRWAALELLLTAPEIFDEAAKARLLSDVTGDNPAFTVDWDWGRGTNLGLYSYLFSGAVEPDATVAARLKEDLLLAADRILANHDAHAYGRGLRGYYWGVNGSVARSTMNLMGAYRLSGDERYRQAAFDQIAYLYGRNPFGRSMVTGDGYNPPMHPHHRPSEGDQNVAPWPGHLVGGPHPGELDWADIAEDASKNENAINWDGALAYALAAFFQP